MAGFAAAIVVSPGLAQPPGPPLAASPIDMAFERLYNFDFAGSLRILDGAAQADPGDPLVSSVRAATYLFMEFDRLRSSRGGSS